MNSIHQKIAAFNEAASKVFEDEPSYFQLRQSQPASMADINKLEVQLGLALPAELVEFYTTFGCLITDRNNESNSFHIPTPAEQIALTQDKERWPKVQSFGLIDQIIDSWGNDRPEFQQYEFFTPRQTSEINAHFKCFGFYRDWWGLESANYLFFDANGQFGVLNYHQDESDAFDALGIMLKEGIPARSLVDTLTEALDKTTAEIVDDGD